jgi:1-acyl-sn-glycerol-3-phosphate acyltransferase
VSLFWPVRAVWLALYRMRIEGRERIPATGGFIVAANHTNWKDPAALEFMLRMPIRFMAKIEAFSIFLIGGMMRGIGCFPVKRGEGDRRALVTCLQVLASGNALGFFPEGTRSRDGVVHRAHPGVAFLAAKADAPILPVGLVGTAQAKLFRSDVWVRVGEPFRVRDLGLPATASDQEVADAIMYRVARLLPPAMRGHYAEDVQKRA